MKNLFYLNRKILSLLIFGLLSFVLNLSAQAQTTDRYSLYYSHFADSNDVSTSTTQGRVAEQLFLDKEGSNLLTISVNYAQTSIQDDNLAGPDEVRKLHAVAPTFNLMTILDEQYSLVVILRPGFYGDSKGSLADDFRLEGGALVTKYMSDKLTLGLGLARGTNLGRDLVVPLFQFLYFASDKVVIRGLLPVRASAWYIPNQDWEFGAVFGLQGSLYNIDDTNIPDAEQVGFATANLGLAARYNFFKKSFMVAEVGFTALRRYEWVENEGPSFDIGKEPLIEEDLNAVPYIKFGWLDKF
jgi:hypothetical protein